MVDCFIEENPGDDFIYVEMKLDGQRVEYFVVPKEYASPLCDSLLVTRTVVESSKYPDYRVHIKNSRNTSTVGHS